jgi:N6-adenosine-specific RNA methylase IME4
MKFGVIFIDPPWNYTNTSKTRPASVPETGDKLKGYCDVEYDLMSNSDLAKLPIGELGTDESVLLMCTTFPFIPAALELMKSWDYEYVTGLTWIKTTPSDLQTVAYGVGYWFRGATELVLVGRRKKAFRTNLVGLVTDGLVSPRLGHSRKPQSLFEVGEAFPGPRLVVFSRRLVEGWYALGNECENDGIDIQKRLKKLIKGTDDWERHYVPKIELPS